MKRWMSGLVAAGALALGISGLAAAPAGATTVDLGVGDAANVSTSFDLPNVMDLISNLTGTLPDLNVGASAGVGDVASVNLSL